MEYLDGVTLKYKIAGRPRCLRGLHRASGEPKSMAARVFGGNRPSSQKRESRQALCPGECSLILLCVAILLYCQSEHLSGSFLIVIKPHLLPRCPCHLGSCKSRLNARKSKRGGASCIPGRLNDGQDSVGLLWKKPTRTSS